VVTSFSARRDLAAPEKTRSKAVGGENVLLLTGTLRDYTTRVDISEPRAQFLILAVLAGFTQQADRLGKLIALD
jgi:hypothetical protein